MQGEGIRMHPVWPVGAGGACVQLLKDTHSRGWRGGGVCTKRGKLPRDTMLRKERTFPEVGWQGWGPGHLQGLASRVGRQCRKRGGVLSTRQGPASRTTPHRLRSWTFLAGRFSLGPASPPESFGSPDAHALSPGRAGPWPVEVPLALPSSFSRSRAWEVAFHGGE